MSPECYPITILPHVSALYREYLGMAGAGSDADIRGWYGGEPFSGQWMHGATERGTRIYAAAPAPRPELADVLERQQIEFGVGGDVLDSVNRLRAGARAVVTGQQVGLFGGPLLTLLKASTAIARAREATRVTGIDHVPVFWLATEDHDLPEVDRAGLLGKTEFEIVRAGMDGTLAEPVGNVVLPEGIEGALDRAADRMDHAPEAAVLREIYRPGETLGRAFARLMTQLFAGQGLIVMDAAGREFHRLGASTLRYAIEHADTLEEALLRRSEQLQARGFHAQVKVAPEMSLLFLISEVGGRPERQALRRTAEGGWKAGRRAYSSDDLLAILAEAPERISPNALLRPVFQDTILPTAAYIGGPAEIAYFAQSEVLYRAILGRVTPVLPRLSATLLEPAIATAMERHEVQLPDAMTTADHLAHRLGARVMPIEGKRRLAAAGQAMDAELDALTGYMGSMNESLGRSAAVSASKMRYQMNRLRRMAARFELEQETSLKRHAEAITAHVFPNGHPQERLVAGVWFVARYGEGLIDRLIAEAAHQCPGHVVVRL